MSQIDQIHIEDFDYDLPEERIAKYPLSRRDSSKLLVYRPGEAIQTARFAQLPSYLSAGSLMVFNDTKVIHARLKFRKETGAQIEVFCLEPHQPNSYEQSLSSTQPVEWLCMIGNARRWKGDAPLSMHLGGEETITLKAELLETLNGANRLVRFSWDAPCSFAEVLDRVGELPIPPYLNRETEEADATTYQTVYAEHDGSVAAPTAGLHFTPEVLEVLQEKGVEGTWLTLHVGAGTFKPVKESQIAHHEMHREVVSISEKTLQQLLKHLGDITAVGTTSTRTLESLYYMGVHLLEDRADPFTVEQWEPYQRTYSYSVREALIALLNYLERHQQTAIHGATRIIIVPGFQFRVIDRLVTNFHQPRSTLLLLISAFVGGEEWKKIYNYALGNDFRFLSYGDSSLLFRP